MRFIRQFRYFSALVSVALAVSLLNPVSANAKTNLIEGTDPQAILFDPLQVNSVSLRMSSSDFNSLKYPNVSWDNEGDWRRTTMNAVIAGKSYGPYTVGVHLKGAWGSWRDVTQKAAFKIKMDAFVAGQTLFGVAKLTLNNMVQDGSMIHEFMTYKLMRESGVPAPRTGYMNVTLNGNNYGLHLNVETIGKTMLKRWGVTSDHIYKGSLPNFPDFNPGAENLFSVESGSPPNRDDLANLMEINRLSGESWWQQMREIVDMEKLTRQWAVEIYASHWDGYMMNRNNYFVNFDKEGKAIMLTWGTDQTWGGAPGYFGFGTVLPNKCFGSTSCLNLYYRSLVKVAVIAQKLKLSDLAQEVANAIYPAVMSDPWVDKNNVAAWQNSAIETQNWRNIELNQMVVQWDTTLNMISVNNSKFEPSDLIYLVPGTKQVILLPIARQPNAIVKATMATFKPGLNSASVAVTSPSGQQSTVYDFKFYVLTQKTNTTQLQFASGKATLLNSSRTALTKLGGTLAKAKVVRFTITKSASLSPALLSKRVKAIEAVIKRAGVGTYQISVENSRVGSNTISLKTNYQE
ncbi:MAG: CotH kinase family protein [Rhodoluna sp.]